MYYNLELREYILMLVVTSGNFRLQSMGTLDLVNSKSGTHISVDYLYGHKYGKWNLRFG